MLSFVLTIACSLPKTNYRYLHDCQEIKLNNIYNNFHTFFNLHTEYFTNSLYKISNSISIKFNLAPFQIEKVVPFLFQTKKYSGIKNKWHIDKHKVNVIVEYCSFVKCTNYRGGALNLDVCNTSIKSCQFVQCYAKNSGAVCIMDSRDSNMTYCSFFQNSAKRFGAMQYDGHHPKNPAQLLNTNLSHNSAKEWIGGIRLQHNSGLISNCIFHQTTAKSYGALWDFNWNPSYHLIEKTYFLNNTAKEDGAAYSSYQLSYNCNITDSIFYKNENQGGRKGSSIYVHSDDDHICISGCKFSGTKEQEIFIFFPDTSDVFESGINYFEYDGDFQNIIT